MSAVDVRLRTPLLLLLLQMLDDDDVSSPLCRPVSNAAAAVAGYRVWWM